MPTFQYQSLSTSGARQSGVISATSRAEAVRTLMQRGETATSITTTMSATTDSKMDASPTIRTQQGSRLGFGRPTLRKTEMATLIRELATALKRASR